MKLFEFFGKSIDVDKSNSRSRDDKGLADDIFWFIVDHDKLHKDYAIPLAKKIAQHLKSNSLDKESMVKEFKPMVNKGCMEFYSTNKMQGNIKTLFPKEMRDELSERLYDHYRDDIAKDQYKLGQ